MLAALTHQTIAPHDFEVVVVADGCTDNTAEIVASFRENINIKLIEQTAQGQAVARNMGAKQATGKLLVFLDDDIEPQASFLGAHLQAHWDNLPRVVIGYYPPILESQTGYLRTELRDWWEVTFQKMRHPGHRFSYSDFLSGNFSIHAEIFENVGGFNPDYRVHEDYELGIRLLQAGVEFSHSIEAIGYHHERSDLERVINRKYEEGIADVQIGIQYPSLRPTLLMEKLDRYSLASSRVLRVIAFYWPSAGDRITNYFRRQLDFVERIRWYQLWVRLLKGLMAYWYWRGVSRELAGLRQLKTFLNKTAARPGANSVLEINLEDDIAKSENILDEVLPDSVRIRLNGSDVGEIPYLPGSEPLRGLHLQPYLVHNLNYELVKALAGHPDFPYPQVSADLISSCDEFIRSKIKWL